MDKKYLETFTAHMDADFTAYARDVLQVKAERPCPICAALGIYPIIDSAGVERYCIECPECHGSGIAPEACGT